MKFTFGDIVVVQSNLIGVVVKCWGRSMNKPEPSYEIYVRSFNRIETYPESRVERYMVRHKELDGAEMEYQDNALKT